MGKPPVAASLTWTGALAFTAASGAQTITIDGDSAAGPSPMQLLGMSLAGCMAIDVIDILKKGRHAVEGLEVRFFGSRAEEPPRRFTSITLTFNVRGATVPADAVRRAIALSHEKYCSVSNSLRGDIAVTTEFEIQP